MDKDTTAVPCASAPATLPEEVANLIWTFKCDLRRATPGDVSEMLLTLCNADDLHKAIGLLTDLARRLAEVESGVGVQQYRRLEARLHEVEGAYRHVKNCLHTSQDRATAAEARVGELEAQLDAIFRREDTQGG